MSQSYIDLFDEKDVIEENKLQTVLTGSKNNAPDQLVLINKFKKTESFNLVFKELLENSLQQKLHIEENKEEIILVTREMDGENLTLFLNFANVTEEKRFDYLYEYLHQAIAYIGFDNYLISILIGQNQVVFKDEQLYLKESLIINRRIDTNMPFSLVAKKIGNTMNKILSTNSNEFKASKKYNEFKDFSDKLIRRDNNYVCIDDIFTAFKSIYFDQKTKNGLLVGDMHPNNMLLNTSVDDESISKELTSSLPEIIEDDTNEKDPAPIRSFTTEVTHEERQILFGVAHEEKEEFENATNEENRQVDDVFSYEKVASTGPVEERIDLSKLSSDTNSLDDLIVNEKEVVKYGVPDALKDKSFINQNKRTDGDKEDDDEKNSKKAFNIKIPIIATALAVIMLLSIIMLPKLFNNDSGEPQRPQALFHIEIQGNSLFCKNLSEAYNDEEVVNSYWKIERDGELKAEENGLNTANFDVSGLSEGTYKITLIVTDSAGRYSDPYTLEKQYQSSESKALENQVSTEAKVASTQSFAAADNASDTESDEPLDSYTLSATVNVTEDYSIQHVGDRSIKADLTENNGTASLSFNNIDMQKKATVSFWLMSNTKEPINIQLIGYNGDTNLFSIEKTYSPKSILSWNIFSTQVSITGDFINADKLVIRLTSEGSVIWFDDLSIKSFK